MLTPGHVEVRMRSADEVRSQPFTLWPIDDLDSLVGLVNRWGNPDSADVTGQFAEHDGRWFFELVAEAE